MSGSCEVTEVKTTARVISSARRMRPTMWQQEVRPEAASVEVSVRNGSIDERTSG